MDIEAYKKNNRPETGAKPGIYKHPEVKEELEVSEFAAADALTRQGWVFDRDAPTASEKAKAEAALAELKAKEEAKKAKETK